MNPASKHNSSPLTTRFLALLLLAGVALVIWLALPGESNFSKDTALRPEDARSLQPPAEPNELKSPPLASSSEPEPRQVVPEVARVIAITCRRQRDAQALPGIRMYRDSQMVGGPSNREGLLEIEAPGTDPFTLWAPGWVPFDVQAHEIPAIVDFVEAKAVLEMRLLNATSEHRVQRILLRQRTAKSNSNRPWEPKMLERGVDFWGTDQLPAGLYDLYLWVIFPDGESHPFARQALVLNNVETTRIEIDLAAPQDFESDS